MYPTEDKSESSAKSNCSPSTIPLTILERECNNERLVASIHFRVASFERDLHLVAQWPKYPHSVGKQDLNGRSP